MSKIIDICERLNLSTSIKNEISEPVAEALSAPILDMTARRSAQMEEERRLVRRTILNGFVGACVVIPKQGLQKVHLHDISEDGLAFDLDYRKGHFAKGEEVAVRVYLNRDSFFPFIVRVSNSRDIPHEGVVRHGASFVGGTINDVALHHFVRFVETVSTSMRSDTGDLLLSTPAGE